MKPTTAGCTTSLVPVLLKKKKSVNPIEKGLVSLIFSAFMLC